MTTLELLQYYANLLILQYKQKDNAYATIQALVRGMIMAQASMWEIFTLEDIPDAGQYKISYLGHKTGFIQWNATNLQIQTALRLVAGLSSVTVIGDLNNSVVVTMTGVTAPTVELEVTDSTLSNSSDPLTTEVVELDETLPIAVQNAFNIDSNLGTTAVGAQLDIVAKYVGVVRSAFGITKFITLDDEEFLQLIQIQILKNSLDSSLADIVGIVNQFFPDVIFVYDHADMRISYLIESGSVDDDLVQMFVSQGVLPKPMGVGEAVIYAPDVTQFFGFRSYDGAAAPTTTPFNNYAGSQDGIFMSYVNAVA